MRHSVLAAVALLAACSTGQSTSAPTPSASSVPDIPAVSKPLDAKAFAADPCGLLPDAAHTELGLPTATKDNASCTLHAGPAGTDPLEFLRVPVMADRGLAGIRAQCGTSSSARCDGWSVDSVNGYPLLRANGETERKYGSCKQFLGVADNVAVLINDIRTSPATSADCARSDKVAAMVITKLS